MSSFNLAMMSAKSFIKKMKSEFLVLEERGKHLAGKKSHYDFRLKHQ